ncbi:lytic transglycosylase domain-containing protein [Methylosinus sp. H3A]|uniref:lytic transglycosylase domain-containing protein n=1 Tax=Methylosinus sp. H3A TaxID=2785786 RepID=UPI0018C2F18F|nr:lytic transglycosylase domain-containing protein [Methylosinus sp. H3A]MBG0808484.1 lytic transglycosylase domain-containing protein [Methylosinus sp. H3A]
MRPALSLMSKSDRLNRACTRARFTLLLLFGLAPVCTLGGVLPAKAAPIERSTDGDPYALHVIEAARRFGIPVAWIRAVMQIESRAHRDAVSPKGAMGLMQIMPDTWSELRARYALAGDPFDPRDNIVAGAAYLRELHDRYGSPGFLAAYNAGPRRYEDYLDGRRSLLSETVAYVAALAPLIEGNDGARPAIRSVSGLSFWIRAPLFVGRPDGARTANHPAPIRTATDRGTVAAMRDMSAIAPRSDGLFVTLSSTEHAQ